PPLGRLYGDERLIQQLRHGPHNAPRLVQGLRHARVYAHVPVLDSHAPRTVRYGALERVAERRRGVGRSLPAPRPVGALPRHGVRFAAGGVHADPAQTRGFWSRAHGSILTNRTTHTYGLVSQPRPRVAYRASHHSRYP